MDLKSIYFNPKDIGSFGGVNRLYQSAKNIYPQITQKNVKDWLSGKLEYSLYKDARKTWNRNRIFVSQIDEQWECDLLDVNYDSRKNKGIRYLLVIIDVFSKYLFVKPLKNKKADFLVKAFEEVFKESGRIPKKIRTDRGLEFENRKFRKMCDDNNIIFFTSTNQTIKCSVVERVNRTLRSRIERAKFHNKGVYYNILQDIVDSYNRSMHRTIGMPPSSVSKSDEPVIFEKMYDAKNMLELFSRKQNKIKFKPGDDVRQKYDLKPLEKSYLQKWTDIVYKVDKVINKLFKPQYIVSLDGSQFERRFYPEELQKVKIDNNSLYLVEKVLGHRTRNNRSEVLVKWRGYPKKYNEWIPKDQIQSL